MARTPVLTALLLAAGLASAEEPSPRPSPSPPSSCLICHAQLDGAALEPTQHTSEDVHFLKGLSCHDCHGGNPAAGADGDPFAAHDERKGFRGKPKRTQVPALCARCHADAAYMKTYNPQARVDQLSEYRTSVHGQQSAKGDERVAVCVDCHGVHGIRAVKDPRSLVYPPRVAETCGRCHDDPKVVGPYGRDSDQHEKYRGSVHAQALYERGDLSAPTCNDCHGSHGAVPPGVQSVANVCGSCHTREATLFRETEAKRKIDLTACIQCMVCHDNHAVARPTDEMLGVGPKSTCTPCHAPGEPQYQASEEMAASLERLKARLGEAESLLQRAERAGVEVGPDIFALRQAQDRLVEARVLAHSFDRERFLGTTDEGLAVADAGVAAGQRAFKELQQRRLGLVVSLAVILAVVAGLLFKLRQIERPPASPAGGPEP